jgi:hypothetical protein
VGKACLSPIGSFRFKDKILSASVVDDKWIPSVVFVLGLWAYVTSGAFDNFILQCNIFLCYVGEALVSSDI